MRGPKREGVIGIHCQTGLVYLVMPPIDQRTPDTSPSVESCAPVGTRNAGGTRQKQLLRPLSAVAVAAIFILAGCGSSKPSNTNSGGGSVTTTGGPGSTCTIPQNNGGDHDADNNGGPSDGDGCDK